MIEERKNCKVVAIIPTIHRPTLCQAIKSALEQYRRPEEVIVVYDDFKPRCEYEVTMLKNTRTKNLSGAINTALRYLIRKGYDPKETFVALLDDDDLWTPDHIQECIGMACNGYDLVISGIIRVQRKGSIGTIQRIPKGIHARMFLGTNPGLQGSNLFVRLDTLLRAGGFDEMMVSTTDRDVGFRITSLPGTKVGIVNKHTVIHNTYSESRLTEPGTPRKREGLYYFYYKYRPIMTNEEREAFKKRARELFKVEISDRIIISNNSTNSNDFLRISGVPAKSLVVGIISTRLKQTLDLLRDLERVKKEGVPIDKIVILSKTPQMVDGIIERTYSIPLEIITEQEITDRYNVFPSFLNKPGISAGRQKLQLYIYSILKNTANHVVWLLDDDILLGYLNSKGEYEMLRACHINGAIEYGLKNDIDIGIGMITGDPPIPPISIIRTSLLDYYYNKIKIDHSSRFSFSINSLPDYYYDYSERHTTHLEMPIWTERKINLKDVVSGRSVSRPVLFNPENSKVSGHILRGGNTLVFNIESLKYPFNVSPIINGKMCRRGDTIWTLINKYRYRMKIEQILLPIYHHRVDGNTNISLEQFIRDLVGRATVRGLIEYYERWIDFKSVVRGKLEQYLLEYRANSYRVLGLIDLIKSIGSLEQNDLEMLFLIERLFSENAYNHVHNILMSIPDDTLDMFFEYVTKFNPMEVIS